MNKKLREIRWRLNQACVVHKWCMTPGSACVIFNEASGQTHAVSDLGMDTLTLLQINNVFSFNELLEALSSCCGLFKDESGHEELETYLSDMLLQFDYLGLIEPCHL